MNTQAFLSSLQKASDKPLVFDYGQGRVKPGYHITEIKATTVQTIDCGGQGNVWSETILQVWSPEPTKDQTVMSVGKFLSIYERVAPHIPVDGNAEMRVEYGDAGAPAISYLVREVDIGEDAVVVNLDPPAVACKGANRFLGDIPSLNASAQPCCKPSPSGACCA